MNNFPCRARKGGADPDSLEGNVSGKGEPIHHLPWQRDYARVRIDEGKGERWFCSEGEAERAGCRRAAR